MPKVVVIDPEYGYRKSRHNNALFLPFLKAENYRQVTDTIYLRPY
jgi:hypothetical protein